MSCAAEKVDAYECGLSLFLLQLAKLRVWSERTLFNSLSYETRKRLQSCLLFDAPNKLAQLPYAPIYQHDRGHNSFSRYLNHFVCATGGLVGFEIGIARYVGYFGPPGTIVGGDRFLFLCRLLLDPEDEEVAVV